MDARAQLKVAGGKFSRDMKINNMVYQGMVLGPPNIVERVLCRRCSCCEYDRVPWTIVRGRFKLFQGFVIGLLKRNIACNNGSVPKRVTQGGESSQVSFDIVKQIQHIIALNGGEGMNFKLLGIPFDNALAMRDAVVQFISEEVGNWHRYFLVEVFLHMENWSPYIKATYYYIWNTGQRPFIMFVIPCLHPWTPSKTRSY